MKKIILSSCFIVSVAIVFGISQPVFASTTWIGNADYSTAPGADGTESTANNFSKYDFGIGASLVRLTSASVPTNNTVSGSFSGYYQSMVTDHFLGGNGLGLSDLNTGGALGDGTGFELTLTSHFTGNYTTDTVTDLTTFSGLTGAIDLFFDTTPDFSFSADTGFDSGIPVNPDGGVILSGTITDGNGLASGLLGIGVNNLELDFSGLFGSFDQNVYEPDTIGGGSALFSINLNNLNTTNSVTNQIINGNNSIMGVVYNPGQSDVLSEADGSLELTAVPLPGAVWLMVSGLVGLVSLGKRK